MSAEFDPRHLPDEHELPKSRLKIVALALLSMFFVAVGVYLGATDPATGLIVTIGFGLFTLVFIFVLVGGFSVALERNGFTVRHLFRSQHYSWRDVSEVTHARVGRTRMILFNDVTHPDRARGFFRRFLHGYNSGFSAGLLQGPLDEVCARMNAFRARALKKP